MSGAEKDGVQLTVTLPKWLVVDLLRLAERERWELPELLEILLVEALAHRRRGAQIREGD